MAETYPLLPLLQGLSPEKIKTLEKQLLRKVDMRLMPTLVIIYAMNYLDRNAIGAARLEGLEEDLGLHGYQFQVWINIHEGRLYLSILFHANIWT